ncbi:type II toxin-antitoxin system HicB family antitoxin [Planococcus beigongshangi]|uniref:type II toxin-antitoxin system HicB family antitoxin n=1 Tax=Planococcus beigongshangi TaxID=2782536 RepID=UPI00193B5BEC|nr:type II toxin-antitoxin system HicB family antitoxin [Planococcus beigongshangi]
MKKNSFSMEQFLEMDYKIVIDPYVNEEYGEKGYVITCPDLAGIKVFGKSIEEAFEELYEAKIAWFEMKEELGEEVLMPEMKSKPSGRLTLRLPIFLHEKVIDYSERNNTSLNNAISFLISEGLNSVEIKSVKKEMAALTREIKKIESTSMWGIAFDEEVSSKKVFDLGFAKSYKKNTDNLHHINPVAGNRLFRELAHN